MANDDSEDEPPTPPKPKMSANAKVTERSRQDQLVSDIVPSGMKSDGKSSSSAEPGDLKRKLTEEDIEDIGIDVKLSGLGLVQSPAFKRARSGLYHGILVQPGVPRKPRRNVTFGPVQVCRFETNDDHVQERVLHQAAEQPAVNWMLARICHWNWGWTRVQTGSPPQLLSGVASLPALQMRLGHTFSYSSQEEYQNEFLPLLLFATWEAISKSGGEHLEIQVLLQEKLQEDSITAIVRCEALVPVGSARLQHHDVALLHLSQTEAAIVIIEDVIHEIVDEVFAPWINVSNCAGPPFVRLQFSIRSKSSAVPPLDRMYAIKRLASIRTHIRQFSMVVQLQYSPLQTVILNPNGSDGLRLLQPADQEEEEEIHELLNENELTAVSSIVATVLMTPEPEPKVVVVETPPGTRKLEVIFQVVEKLVPELQARKQKLLICARSNDAAVGLATHLKMVCHINAKLIGAQLPIDMYDTLLGADVLCTSINSWRSQTMDRVFIGARQDGSRPAQILCCIILDASQCSELESLAPIGLGFSKLVLVGDFYEFHPTTFNSDIAWEHQRLRSLFGRLMGRRWGRADQRYNIIDANSLIRLTTQYRMVSPICEWPSRYFYENRLVTCPVLDISPIEYQGIECQGGIAVSITNKPSITNYRLLHVYQGREKAIDNSFTNIMNEKEAYVVQGIVHALSIFGIPNNLGIITFYQRQKELIIDLLNRLDLNGSVEVDTADAFQNKEKNIIIVSCVRANFDGDVGVVSSERLMNVALTRASHSLIVCGHFDTLRVNEAWRSLIEDAEERDLIDYLLVDYPDPEDLGEFIMNELNDEEML